MNRPVRVADRLTVGSRAYVRRLGARAAAWCARGRREDLSGWRAALGPLLRLACIGVGLVVLCLVVRARPKLMLLLASWWAIASWCAGKPAADSAQETADDDQQEEAEASPADRLARHVLAELAALEEADRPGVHVTALIASAEEERLLAPGSMDKAAMRAWLEASGLPVTKSVKVAGDVDYGVRVDRVTEALGIGPGEALARTLGGGPAGATPPAPATTPTKAGAWAPVGAAPAAAQGHRLTLVKPLPEGASTSSAQGAA